MDPLDGTTNFAHGYPSFAVSVAVLRHATPVAAAVVEFGGGPGSWVTRTYTAARNGGAQCNGKSIQVWWGAGQRPSTAGAGKGLFPHLVWGWGVVFAGCWVGQF